jgi:hypothetical protein
MHANRQRRRLQQRVALPSQASSQVFCSATRLKLRDLCPAAPQKGHDWLPADQRRGAIASARSLRALVKQRREALGSGSWCMPASPDDHIAAASDHSVTAVGVRGELVLTVSSALGTTIPVH